LPTVVLPASPLRRLLFLSLLLALAFLERRPLPTRHELSLSPAIGRARQWRAQRLAGLVR
jgi:hypothetical protein